MNIPQFTNKSELFKFLRENKKFLINSKKSQIKYSDNCSFEIDKSIAKKSVRKLQTDTETELFRNVVTNTSNYLDSHGDVHIGNIWTKSLKENSDRVIFFQEHKQHLDKIIADGNDLKISVETMPFKDLGYNSTEKTDALIFNSVIKKSRNGFMFNQYKAGYIKQHSVGMRYVKMALCMDSTEPYDQEGKVSWDKYYPQIANKELADEKKFFWAVTEAILIEGSAVALGSNPITPTLEQKDLQTLSEEIDGLKSQIALLTEKENPKPIENNFYTFY